MLILIVNVSNLDLNSLLEEKRDFNSLFELIQCLCLPYKMNRLN